MEIRIADREVLYYRYHNKKDIIDIQIDNDASGKRLPGGSLADHGLRLVKYHCPDCLLIFGYDRPTECPGCGFKEGPDGNMVPGLPGRLVKRLSKRPK